MNYSERISKAIDLMAEEGFDALILSRPSESRSIFYLTGVNRLCANFILNKNGKSTLLILEQDLLDAGKISYVDNVLTFNSARSQFELIANAIMEQGLNGGIIGIEKPFVHQNYFESLRNNLPSTFQIKDATIIAGKLRLTKTEEEIQLIKKASKIASKTMITISEMIKPGLKENELAAIAEYELRKNGAEETATKTFIASGLGTMSAHPPVSSRRIQKEDIVFVDLHPRIKGYCSDLATTFAMPKVNPSILNKLKLISDARIQTMREIEVGDKISKIHSRYFNELKDLDLILPVIPFFNNIHGIGVAPNDPPSFWYPVDVEIKPGTVFAFSQSPVNIWLPTQLGIKFEDTYLVRKKGIEKLTGFKHKI